MLAVWAFNRIFSKQVCYSTPLGVRRTAQRRSEGKEVLERAERQTDWTLIVQDRVTERIMGESHSVWLAIYWSIGLSS